jgi:hypothetical protein
MHAPFRPMATLAAMLLAVVACSGPAVTSPPAATGTGGPRPSSPATVAIIEPTAGAKVTGATLHIVLQLNGATIVPATTTSITPTTGHVHLYVDNQLVSMNYGLEQDIPITPGSHVLKAEFVAADHAPFNPRVNSPEIIITVQ